MGWVDKPLFAVANEGYVVAVVGVFCLRVFEEHGLGCLQSQSGYVLANRSCFE